MAKAASSRTRPVAPAAAATSALPFPGADQFVEDDPLPGLLEQFGAEGGYRVRLDRVGDKGKRAYLTTFPLSHDLIDEVKREYGGGSYRGRVIDPEYQYIRGGSISFTIDGPPIVPGAAAAAATPASAIAGVGSIARELETTGVTTLFESFQNSNRATLALIERIAQPQRPAVDVVALAGVVVPIVLELIKGARTKALTIDEVKAAIETSRSAAPASNPKEWLELVRDFLELQSSIGGNAATDSTASVAMRTFGPALARLIEGAPAPIGAIAPPPGAAPLPDSSPTMSEPAWATELRGAVGQLKRVASEGGDPRLLASGIISFFMPARQKGLLRELVAHPDAQELVITRFPELAAYPEWLADFIDEARGIFGLLEEPEDDPTSLPPAPAPPAATPPKKRSKS